MTQISANDTAVSHFSVINFSVPSFPWLGRIRHSDFGLRFFFRHSDFVIRH
jgi:hypothetical protein